MAENDARLAGRGEPKLRELARMAHQAARAIEGVARMRGRLSEWLRRSSGIRLHCDKEGYLIAEVRLIVRYGCDVHAVSLAVQAAVHDALSRATSRPLGSVCVMVCGNDYVRSRGGTDRKEPTT